MVDQPWLDASCLPKLLYHSLISAEQGSKMENKES